MPDSLRLVCATCGTAYAAHDTRIQCGCGGLLSVERDLGALDGSALRACWAERWATRAGVDGSGVWRYRELVADPSQIITRGEGNTFLYRSPAVSSYAGVDDLALKHEGENPSGSFKDRGMTVGISQALAGAARAVVCASTGNTSSSLASYAALAGLPCLVLVPAGKVATGKLAQSLAYGAQVIQVEGDFDAALAAARDVCREMGLYLLNSINPWRVEGQKSIVFELMQQRQWSAPDWIVLPGGNLGNTSAFGKALRELRHLGLLARLPRLAVVQAAGANPFYSAFRDDFHSFSPVHAQTVATAINIGNPANYPRAVQAVQETNGLVTEVNDEAILAAKAVIDRAGIGCEPASAASLAGVRRLVAEGAIGPGDSVVGILTGHLLKDSDATMRYYEQHAGPPLLAQANAAAVRAAIEQAAPW